MRVGNSSFNAIWVWNRNNVFDPSASSSVAGTVQVAGLNTGTYSGTWWDTFAGVPISNFTFTVTSTNLPVTLNTPAILRSAALYVGPPPQANVIAPESQSNARHEFAARSACRWPLPTAAGCRWAIGFLSPTQARWLTAP